MFKHLNQCKYEVILLGVVNIDFLKYNSHQPAELYLDTLCENNFMQIIAKPTRITDHAKTHAKIDQFISIRRHQMIR